MLVSITDTIHLQFSISPSFVKPSSFKCCQFYFPEPQYSNKKPDISLKKEILLQCRHKYGMLL